MWPSKAPVLCYDQHRATALKCQRNGAAAPDIHSEQCFYVSALTLCEQWQYYIQSEDIAVGYRSSSCIQQHWQIPCRNSRPQWQKIRLYGSSTRTLSECCHLGHCARRQNTAHQSVACAGHCLLPVHQDVGCGDQRNACKGNQTIASSTHAGHKRDNRVAVERCDTRRYPFRSGTDCKGNARP